MEIVKLQDIYLLMICAGLLFTFLSSASACGAGAFHWPLEGAIENSDEIFIGELLAIDFVKYKDCLGIGDSYICTDRRRARFKMKVLKKWKGSHDDIVYVFGGFTSCGTEPILNCDQQLIFAGYSSYDNGYLWAEIFGPKNVLTMQLPSRSAPLGDCARYFDMEIPEDQPALNKQFPDGVFTYNRKAVTWIVGSLIVIGLLFLGLRCKQKATS